MGLRKWEPGKGYKYIKLNWTDHDPIWSAAPMHSDGPPHKSRTKPQTLFLNYSFFFLNYSNNLVVQILLGSFSTYSKFFNKLQIMFLRFDDLQRRKLLDHPDCSQIFERYSIIWFTLICSFHNRASPSQHYYKSKKFNFPRLAQIFASGEAYQQKLSTSIALARNVQLFSKIMKNVLNVK